jgi:hypothetical protein
MEPILAWISGHPDTTIVLAAVWISTLLVIGYLQNMTRRLELRMRVLINGHQAYYTKTHPSESGAFSETETYKQYHWEAFKDGKR